MEYEIKELGIGGILDQSLNLIKNNFAMLMAIFLISIITILLTFGVWGFAAGFFDRLAAETVYEESLPMDYVAWIVGGILLSICVYSTAYGAVIAYLSKKYLGKTMTLKSTFGAGLERLLPLTWATVLFVLALAIVGGIGFGLGVGAQVLLPGKLALAGLVAPVVTLTFLAFLYFRWGLIGPIIIIERIGGLKAFKRSSFLMKKNKHKLLVIILILIVCSMLIELSTLFFINHIASLTVKVLSQLISFFIGTTAITVLYFSARCQKESFDLQILADSLATTDKSDTQAETAPVK
jgi:hypothetical protein